MRIAVPSAIIQEAIRVATRLAVPMTGNLTLESDGKTLKLKSTSEVARCVVLIPGEVSGEALLAVPVESLRDATKGREDLELGFDKGMLTVKGGRYLTKLATVDAISDEDAESSEKGQQWKLTPEQAKWLKTAVAQVALKSNVSIESFMPASVKISDKGAFVACYDNNHMAFMHSKDITGSLEVTFPLDTLNAVLDVFNELACTMTVTKSSLRVKNKIVDVTLSLPDQEGGEAIEINAVVEKSREALKSKGKDVLVPKSEVQKFLENAKSVATKERSEVKCEVEPGKMTLSVNTTNGSSRATIKAQTKAKASFAVDYEFFHEAVAKGVDELNIKVVDEGFLMISGKNAYNVMALNQEG